MWTIEFSQPQAVPQDIDSPLGEAIQDYIRVSIQFLGTQPCSHQLREKRNQNKLQLIHEACQLEQSRTRTQRCRGALDFQSAGEGYLGVAFDNAGNVDATGTNTLRGV